MPLAALQNAAHAVRNSVEHLLNDLTAGPQQSKSPANTYDSRSSTAMSTFDKEPMYEPQRPTRSATGLEDLEQLLDDYDSKRSGGASRPNAALQSVRDGGTGASVNAHDQLRSASAQQRPTVESLLSELDDSANEYSSRGGAGARQTTIVEQRAIVTQQQRSQHTGNSKSQSSIQSFTSARPPSPKRALSPSSRTPSTPPIPPPPHSQPLSPQHRRVDAGSVSKDLDKLLGSLSGFNLKACKKSESPTGEVTYTWKKQAPIPVPKVNADGEIELSDSSDLLKRKTMNAHAGPSPRVNDQLDSMLGSLSADMSKHGIQTVPKGDCHACNKVIVALGKMWHPEHFVCCQCGEELGHRNFFERGGKAYCENDYHNLFSPRCAYCNGAIKDKCITALDRTWHVDHFFCAHCGKEFGEDGFHEKDGKAYCRVDFFQMYAPRCKGCTRPIQANFITALGTQWHPECFVCQECKQPFAGGNYYEHEHMPYCEQHYHTRRGTLCFACQKPISGRCVTAMERKYHPEHFACSFCRRELNKGIYKEHDHKPYCQRCFSKLLQ